MKKLIELNNRNKVIMNAILCEEIRYNPKKICKFSIIHETENDGTNCKFYLYHAGKLDVKIYGELMYRLGIESQKG